MTEESLFWQDLRRDLEDPELLREYITQYIRIRTVDRIVNSLDDARIAAHMSKAELARAINSEPANLRRLLTGKQQNPTISTVAQIAGVLGYKLALVPLTDEEQKLTTVPLLSGSVDDPAPLLEPV